MAVARPPPGGGRYNEEARAWPALSISASLWGDVYAAPGFFEGRGGGASAGPSGRHAQGGPRAAACRGRFRPLSGRSRPVRPGGAAQRKRGRQPALVPRGVRRLRGADPRGRPVAGGGGLGPDGLERGSLPCRCGPGAGAGARGRVPERGSGALGPMAQAPSGGWRRPVRPVRRCGRGLSPPGTTRC